MPDGYVKCESTGHGRNSFRIVSKSLLTISCKLFTKLNFLSVSKKMRIHEQNVLSLIRACDGVFCHDFKEHIPNQEFSVNPHPCVKNYLLGYQGSVMKQEASPTYFPP